MPDVLNGNPEVYLERFGLESFRTGQRDVIQTVLDGQDCLCVMPTGGGKSLCYQLPAVMSPGLTLVVSPLIALMKDQVDQLAALNIPVSFINSTLSLAEQYERLDRTAAGEYQLLYVVPERFRSSRFLEAVRATHLKLLAVDEAHCISEWGHDFRPDYARLGHYRSMLGFPTTIALTATATDAVRRDIVEQLRLREPRTFVTGFARPNLFYEVRHPGNERQKSQMMLDFLRRTPGSGIIYTSSRKRTEEVAETVRTELDRSAVAYHAGMRPDDRRRTQEAFMSGSVDVIAATTAFGMGIDKADVRFVVHYNLPGTLEAYYQEAGRAGRDGEPSRCLLLFSMGDRFIQEYFIESAYPAPEHVEAVYEYLRHIEADPIEMTQQDIKARLGLPIGGDGVGACEQLLESAGVLERMIASENNAAVRLDSDLPTLIDMLPRNAKNQRHVLRAIEEMVGDRRQELVYFRPGELARRVTLDGSALTTSLRELNKLSVFTYVPPFRGRAIRMISRDQSFEELDVDFEANERLKTIEYDKLRLVITFAQSRNCRQREILRYFGDASDDRCGHCDNCHNAGFRGDGDESDAGKVESAASPPVSPLLLRTVRIILSGVARTEARMACGKNLIALMLCGSTAARVGKLGLNKLSTFGLLKHLKQTEVSTLITGLIGTGFLDQVEIEPHRPVVKLTERGADVMRGTAELLDVPPMPDGLKWKLASMEPGSPGRGDTKASSTQLPPEATQPSRPLDPALRDALKQWRDAQAAQSGLPHYSFLTNATIDAIASEKPDTPEALLAVKGIGETKLRRHGEALLQIVRERSGRSTSSPSEPESSTATLSNPTTASPPTVPTPAAPVAWEETKTLGPEPTVEHRIDQPVERPTPRPPEQQPTHHWTWRLLDAGLSAEECMAARSISREDLLDHLLRAADEGLPVRASWGLEPDLLAAMHQVVGSTERPQIRQILPQLPADTRYEEVVFYLKSRRA